MCTLSPRARVFVWQVRSSPSHTNSTRVLCVRSLYSHSLAPHVPLQVCGAAPSPVPPPYLDTTRAPAPPPTPPAQPGQPCAAGDAALVPPEAPPGGVAAALAAPTAREAPPEPVARPQPPVADGALAADPASDIKLDHITSGIQDILRGKDFASISIKDARRELACKLGLPGDGLEARKQVSVFDSVFLNLLSA